MVGVVMLRVGLALVVKLRVATLPFALGVEMLHRYELKVRGLLTALVLFRVRLIGPQLSEIGSKSARGLASSIMGLTIESTQLSEDVTISLML